MTYSEFFRYFPMHSKKHENFDNKINIKNYAQYRNLNLRYQMQIFKDDINKFTEIQQLWHDLENCFISNVILFEYLHFEPQRFDYEQEYILEGQEIEEIEFKTLEVYTSDSHLQNLEKEIEKNKHTLKIYGNLYSEDRFIVNTQAEYEKSTIEFDLLKNKGIGMRNNIRESYHASINLIEEILTESKFIDYDYAKRFTKQKIKNTRLMQIELISSDNQQYVPFIPVATTYLRAYRNHEQSWYNQYFSSTLIGYEIPFFERLQHFNRLHAYFKDNLKSKEINIKLEM